MTGVSLSEKTTREFVFVANLLGTPSPVNFVFLPFIIDLLCRNYPDLDLVMSEIRCSLGSCITGNQKDIADS